MIVGRREEDEVSKVIRHVKETKDNIDFWQKIVKDAEELGKTPEFPAQEMVTIWRNTLKELKDILHRMGISDSEANMND